MNYLEHMAYVTHTITSYHVKCHRFIIRDTDLPISTMTDECGIGMSAGGFENHWRMNVLVCQRSNGVQQRSQVSTQLIALERGQIVLLMRTWRKMKERVEVLPSKLCHCLM